MPSWQDLIEIYASDGLDFDRLHARLTAALQRIAALR